MVERPPDTGKVTGSIPVPRTSLRECRAALCGRRLLTDSQAISAALGLVSSTFLFNWLKDLLIGPRLCVRSCSSPN